LRISAAGKIIYFMTRL